MKKVIYWLVLLILIPALVLSAVGQQEGVKPEGKVTISYWTQSTGDEVKKGFEEFVLDNFHKSHPNIKVEVRYLAVGDEYLATTKAGLASGEKGPDLFLLYGAGSMIEYVNANLLYDLTEYAEKYRWRDKMFSWGLDTRTYKGKLWGMVAGVDTMHVFYNKTQFDEYGWTPPETYDQLLDISQKIEEKGKIPFAAGTRGFTPANHWWISVFVNQWAGAANVYKALKGSLPLTDEVFVEAFRKFKVLWDEGWIMDKRMFDLTVSDARARLGDQTALMLMEGSWGVKYMPRFVEDFEWDIALFPLAKGVTKRSVPLASGYDFGVNRATKHPDATLEFLNYFIEDPKRAHQMAEATMKQYWPLVKSDPTLYLSPQIDHRVRDMMKMIYDIQTVGEYGYPMWTFWPKETDVYLYENLPRILFEQISIGDYLSKAQQLLAKEINEGKVPPMPIRKAGN